MVPGIVWALKACTFNSQTSCNCQLENESPVLIFVIPTLLPGTELPLTDNISDGNCLFEILYNP